MKKLIIFAFLAILLCGIKAESTQKIKISNIFPNSSFEIFTSQKSNINFDKINNGDGEIIFCSNNEFNKIYSQNKYITGFNIKTNKNINNILKDLNCFNIKSFNNNIYAFSPVIKKILLNKSIPSVVINNQEFNVQINISAQNTLIGCPINLGSY